SRRQSPTEISALSLHDALPIFDGGQIALETAGQVPEWAAPGATVQALGWQTKVVSVDGSKIVISLSKSKASRVELDSEVVVRERSEEHTSELQSRENLVCRLLL